MIEACLCTYHQCQFKVVWWRDKGKKKKSGTNGAISGKYDENFLPIHNPITGR
jgi:hypothetical protein